MFTKDQIIAFNPKPTRLEVAQLGEVFIRLLSEAEAREMFDITSGDDNKARAKFVVKSLCDAEGNRTFEDGDLDAVLKIPFCATFDIFTQGMQLNYPSKEGDAGKN